MPTEPTPADLRHECPYKSLSEYRRMDSRMDNSSYQRTWIYSRLVCGGETGWLCDRCKEDRADQRAAKLAKVVANGI